MDLPILRWEGYIPPKQPQIQLQAYPLVYVRPADPLKFWSYVEKNGGTVVATVHDSRSIYDQKTVPAIPQKVPLRPNYSAATGDIGVLLGSNWYGYPPQPGTLRI